MSFVSYAQNFEDIMLWRALKHIKDGFYIDVGAWSPDIDSVTKAFYEAGWHGINIEPHPEYNNQYSEARKKDINLCVAVSDRVGDTEMYFVSNPGLSSLDKGIAEGHKILGWESTPTNIKTTTLTHICNEHCLKKDIHFLKIDVEGFEKQVIKGNDWLCFRPWVVVVEATRPMSQIENHEDWEPLLLHADYIFAYADGLNRFYVSREHEELLPAFKYPPNVFDQFQLAAAKQAIQQIVQAEAKATHAENKTIQAETKVEQLHVELRSIYTSNSWRITTPLRWINRNVKHFLSALRGIKK